MRSERLGKCNRAGRGTQCHLYDSRLLPAHGWTKAVMRRSPGTFLLLVDRERRPKQGDGNPSVHRDVVEALNSGLAEAGARCLLVPIDPRPIRLSATTRCRGPSSSGRCGLRASLAPQARIASAYCNGVLSTNSVGEPVKVWTAIRCP